MRDVQATMRQFEEAWNRHDADALAAMWTEDGELDHPWGFRAVGREAIRRLLADEHAGAMRASVLRVTDVSAREETPNVVADVEGILEQVHAPNGRPYDLRHRLSVMFVPSDEEWRIRVMTAVANPRS